MEHVSVVVYGADVICASWLMRQHRKIFMTGYSRY